MSFATEVSKSRSCYRVLVEVDIAPENTEWVNHGAGIWVYSPNVLYSWVDASLLDGFSGGVLVNVGSVYSDTYPLTEVSTIAALTPNEYHWDHENNNLYVCLVDYDEPSLHTVWVGEVYGFSFTEFTPSGMGTSQPYYGRLSGAPKVTIAQDPLFFGRVTYGGGSVRIVNQDGEYDTFAQDNNIYGNQVRILLGFDGLDYDDYERVYTGNVEKVTVAEDYLSIAVADPRKQLSRAIEASYTGQNPVYVIRDILETYFGASYDSDYFDTTAWASAESTLDSEGISVTIDMQEPAPANEVIEQLCVAATGVFYVNAEGKYTFKVVDPDATTTTVIRSDDILSQIRVVYDPTEVVSSFRVGHSRDWATTGTQYTYATYNTYESSVYTAYKTYNERKQDTYLSAESDADAWADLVYPRHTEVHGSVSIDVPFSYYGAEILDTVDVELNRPQQTMLGTVVSEIKSISWSFGEVPTISLGIRFT